MKAKKIKKEINNNEADKLVADIGNRLDLLERKIGQKINDVRDDIRTFKLGVGEQIEGVNDQLDKLDERFDGVEAKINILSNRVDRFADHDRRIMRVERKVGISKED